MKLRFDAHQDYQLRAVAAVTSLFLDQNSASSAPRSSNFSQKNGIAFTEDAVANCLPVSPPQILTNLQAIQAQNGLDISSKLESTASNDGKTVFCPLNFTIEMETGTGKTYTYLRTIYELNRQFGFSKFVIAVPNVAIREGVWKNLELTHAHFQAIYDAPPVQTLLYARENAAILRNFASAAALSILVINIDSFAKDSNVIFAEGERGLPPMEYIRQTNPVVIVDEPQNFETEIRKQALGALNPLFLLRYSATHRHLYNLVFSLNPVQAYDLGLVKQIEVEGIIGDIGAANGPELELLAVFSSINGPKATFKLWAHNAQKQLVRLEKTVSVGANLYEESGGVAAYRSGFVVEKIQADHADTASQNVEVHLSSGQILRPNAHLTDQHASIQRYQIERTVFHHFEKIRRFAGLKVKVLSLFFIDKVQNYRQYAPDSGAIPGKFALWFEEAFTNEAQKPENQGLIPFLAQEVHNGYFAQDKQKSKTKSAILEQTVWVDSKERNTKLDDDVFSLIMRDKERLLDLAVPLQFIFSHSALREGWDNPNVFQICTLNESQSTLRKRQEIGRGLRLPIDSTGMRVRNRDLNVLTVVANEHYEAFAAALQREIEEETSVRFEGRVRDARKESAHTTATEKGFSPEKYPEVYPWWLEVQGKSRFDLRFDGDALLQNALLAFNDASQFPTIEAPTIQATLVRLDMDVKGVQNTILSREKQASPTEPADSDTQIEEAVAFLQEKIPLRRSSLRFFLLSSGRLEEMQLNKTRFLEAARRCLMQELHRLMAEGLVFRKNTVGLWVMSFHQKNTPLLDMEGAKRFDNLPNDCIFQTPLGVFWPKSILFSDSVVVLE